MKSIAWSMAIAVALQSSVVWALTPKEVYKKAGPAVVLILGSDDGKSGSGGTGSIISPDGKVLTNAHVVLNEHNQPFKILYVFLKPPRLTGDNAKDLANRYKARVVRYSVPDELDLALVQIEDPPASLATIAFGNPNEVEVGDEAIAIGHPEQGGLWTLTTGSVSTVISNFNRVKGKDVFQTEASVNRGNSGGPLLDVDGNVIGINTMIARQGAGGVAITGVNFSLKSSVAVKWLSGQGMGLAYAARGEPPVVVATAEPRKSAPPPAEPPATKSVVETPAPQPEVTPPPTKPTPPANGVDATIPKRRGQQNNTVAPQADAGTTPAEPPVAAAPAQEQPQATIVVVEPPPKPEDVAKTREEGKTLGKSTSKEKVVSGKPLDPKAAKPKYVTDKRPYSLDDLRRQQMKDLENMMNEMRGKVDAKRKGGDMGLW